MAHWAEFEAAEGELAARVKAILTARKHHTLGTLVRRICSPRLWGRGRTTDADPVLGIMPNSGLPGDRPPAMQGDGAAGPDDRLRTNRWRERHARLAGRSERRRPDAQPAGPGFWFDITEVVLTHLNNPATQLAIESWHPGRGREVKHRT